MSKILVTNYFRLNQIDQFRESITEQANTAYYIYVGRSQPYPNTDSIIPAPLHTTEEVDVTSYRNMLFGKRISSSDVKVMVPRYDWAANTKYDAYRDNVDLANSNYYVCVNAVSTYHVFKVLDNNNGALSVVKPELSDTAADDDFYSTPEDGYVWKYMYSVDKTTFDRFATDTHIPVVPNANVAANAVSGAIDVITVSSRGSNYDTYFSNTFNAIDLRIGGNTVLYGLASDASANDNFYTDSYLYIKSGTGVGQIRKIVDYVVVGTTKRVVLDNAFNTAPDVTSEYEITPGVDVVGDGTGAAARAIVNTAAGGANSIHMIEIVNRGTGYTYASAEVTGNTGGVSNSAVLVPIIGPKGGHGYNAEYELGGRFLGLSATFANSENGTIPTDNDYRSIGLLKNPAFANVTLTLTSVTGNFATDEVVTQDTTNARGYVTTFSGGNQLSLTNVTGVFTTARVVTGATSNAVGTVSSFKISNVTKGFNTFDQRHRYVATVDSGTFIEDETVYQTTPSTANALFHSSNSTHVSLTSIEGVINTGNTIVGVDSGAIATLSTYQVPDLVPGSGEVLYVENASPVSRSNTQSEIVKLILKF